MPYAPDSRHSFALNSVSLTSLGLLYYMRSLRQSSQAKTDMFKINPLPARLIKASAHYISIFFLFSVIFLVFFSPVIWTDHLLAFGDAKREFLPAFASSPGLWTNLLFAGFPTAAEPQNQCWYWITYLLPRSPAGWNMFVISAYVLAAIFTYAYLYDITASPIAAMTAGLTYSMSGFMMALLPHTNIIHTAAWLPLTVLALHKLATRPGLSFWWWTEIFSVATAMTAGHPQIFVYSIELNVLFIVYTCFIVKNGNVKFLIVSSLGLIFGLALASVQIIPCLELARLSVRSHLSFADFIGGSFPINQVSTFLFPLMYGGLSQSFYGLPYLGYWNFGNLSGYIGLLPLLLGATGLVSSTEQRSPQYFWVAVALFAFLLALGGGTPLASMLFHIPLYNLFRVQARHLVEVSFAISVMAGYGAASLRRNTVSLSLLCCIIASLGALLLLTAIIEFWLKAPAATLRVNGQLNPAVVVPFAIFAISASAAVICRQRLHMPHWQAVFLIILLVDLGSFGWFCNWRFEAAPVALWSPPDYARRYSTVLQTSRQRMIAVRGAFGSESTIPPNLSQLWHVPTAGGYGSLIPSAISRLLQMPREGGISSGGVGPDWWSTRNQSLDILGVRYAFVPQSEWRSSAGVIDRLSSQRWRFIENVGTTAVVENLHAAPRAWLASQVLEARPDDILRAVKTSRMPDGSIFESAKIALVDETAPVFRSKLTNPYSGVSIELLTDSVAVIRVRSTEASLLVLSDSYYPGWRATVDGIPSHIYRTDYVLRGVVVPPGTHLVRFYFSPTSFVIGAVVSGAVVLVLIVTWVILQRWGKTWVRIGRWI